MMLEKWFVEHVRVWPDLKIESNTTGAYLVFRGNTPATLEGNLRQLGHELVEAADQIRESTTNARERTERTS